jgi:WD40 repeat protein
MVRSVAFVADGRFAVSASEDRTLRFWEMASGRCVRSEPASGQVLSVSISADGRWAAAGTYDRRVLLFELEWD